MVSSEQQLQHDYYPACVLIMQMYTEKNGLFHTEMFLLTHLAPVQ